MLPSEQEEIRHPNITPAYHALRRLDRPPLARPRLPAGLSLVRLAAILGRTYSEFA